MLEDSPAVLWNESPCDKGRANRALRRRRVRSLYLKVSKEDVRPYFNLRDTMSFCRSMSREMATLADARHLE